MTWVKYEPGTELKVLHKIYPHGIYLPDFFFDKNIVHLPTVKCHIYTTTTGAMKNAFGGLLSTHRHYAHSWIHETLVDLLKIQRDTQRYFCRNGRHHHGEWPGAQNVKAGAR